MHLDDDWGVVEENRCSYRGPNRSEGLGESVFRN